MAQAGEEVAGEVVAEFVALVGGPEGLAGPEGRDTLLCPVGTVTSDDLAVENVGIAAGDVMLDLGGDGFVEPEGAWGM